jgi:hypothetical protein
MVEDPGLHLIPLCRRKIGNDNNVLDRGREIILIWRVLMTSKKSKLTLGKVGNREKRETSERHLSC